MNQHKALDGKAIGCMLLFCGTMGVQQVSMKMASADIAPIMMVAIRSAIAAALVGLLIFFRKGSTGWEKGAWPAGLLAGALFSLEYLFVGEGLKYTSASHMAVFLYTAPAFAALGLHWKIPSERMRPLQWFGMLLAFAGIGTAFLFNSPSEADGHSYNFLAGDFLGLLGGMSWGATTVTIRTTRLARVSASQTLLYQLLGAFVLLPAFALILGRTEINVTPNMLAHLTFQTIAVSFAASLLWFWLLTKYLASRLGVLSFMTPLFGVAAGVIFLNEPLEPNFVAGACLVLTGLVLVSGHGWIKQRFLK